MSFAALSTKMDRRIVSFMDHHSLNNMSRTPKYYRQITEPLLYRHLAFERLDHTATMQLSVVLMNRQDLASYIKSFKLDGVDNLNGVKTSENFSSQLLKSFPNIQNIIVEVLGSDASAADQLRWLHTLVAEEIHVDGYLALILALILSLATNLDSLSLWIDHEMEPLPITLKVIVSARMPTTQIAVPADSNNTLETIQIISVPGQMLESFAELQHLRIENGRQVTIPVVPSLLTLKIQNSTSITLGSPKAHHGALPVHLLDFLNIDIEREAFVSRNSCRRLHQRQSD
jgi:hypothetical protein